MFFAISERLVLPKINAPGARKSRVQKINAPDLVWYIDFGLPMPWVHCFWFADTPRCIDFWITEIHRNAWYMDFGFWVYWHNWGVGPLNMAEHEDEGLLAHDVYVEGGLDLVNHEPEKHDDDDDGDHGDGDGDAVRCPSFSPILVDSFKRQYGSRRQQLWLWYALVGRGPIQWAYHGPKYIKIEFRCLEFNFYACNVSTQLYTKQTYIYI